MLYYVVLISAVQDSESVIIIHISPLKPSTLFTPVDCSTPDSSVRGILQARILGWVAISPPGALPYPGIKPLSPASSALAGGFFIAAPPRKSQLYL